MILYISLSFWCRDLVGWINFGERIRFRLCIHIPWVGVPDWFSYQNIYTRVFMRKYQITTSANQFLGFAVCAVIVQKENWESSPFLYSKCVCHLITEGGSGVISVSTPSSCCYWNQNICTFAMTLLFYVLETLIYPLNRLESAFHSFRDDPEFEVSLPVQTYIGLCIYTSFLGLFDFAEKNIYFISGA